MRSACVAMLVLAACSSGGVSGPSVEEGGLPVYSVGAPKDLETRAVAEAFAEVLDLPEDASVFTRGPFEAQIDGAGHRLIVRDRRAGSVGVSYSGPLFDNPGCTRCEPLDGSDDPEVLIDRSEEILTAIGIDLSDIEWSSRDFPDDQLLLQGDVVIEGAVIDDLRFDFFWAHDQELVSFGGGIYEVEVVGTVAGVGEDVARTRAEEMLGSGREIVEFRPVYTGGFRDGELIVAPAYVATTDLGTEFSVSAFEGPLPR